MIENWPDDPTFDPRLYWAEKNSENLSLLLIAKKSFDLDMQILKALEEGPKSVKDLAFLFKSTDKKIQGHLNRLQNKNVKFKKTKIKWASTIYEIISQPKNLRFIY